MMELKNYFVKELTIIEQNEINGGVVVWKILGALVIAVIADWDNFKKGLAGEPEIAK